MKETFKDLVSGELRSLRAKCGYSQKDVAAKAGIDTMTLVRYENNSTSMQLDMIEKIISIYKINMEYFFKLVNANMHNKEKE